MDLVQSPFVSMTLCRRALSSSAHLEKQIDSSTFIFGHTKKKHMSRSTSQVWPSTSYTSQRLARRSTCPSSTRTHCSSKVTPACARVYLPEIATPTPQSGQQCAVDRLVVWRLDHVEKPCHGKYMFSDANDAEVHVTLEVAQKVAEIKTVIISFHWPLSPLAIFDGGWRAACSVQRFEPEDWLLLLFHSAAFAVIVVV